jgi:hypothetical protein
MRLSTSMDRSRNWLQTSLPRLIAQADDEGRRQMMLGDIMDQRTAHKAIPKSQQMYVNSYGVSRKKSTTRGWELIIEWKDGSTDCVVLNDLAKRVVPRGSCTICHQPKGTGRWACICLVDAICDQKVWTRSEKVNSKYWSRTHKYGVLFPKPYKKQWRLIRSLGIHCGWMRSS